MPEGPLLLLENDLPLVTNDKITHTLLKQSLEHLYKYKAAQVRLRSIKDPGEPFHAINKYRKYWGCGTIKKIKRLLRPNKAKKLIGTGIYTEKDPHRKFPKYISKFLHRRSDPAKRSGVRDHRQPRKPGTVRPGAEPGRDGQ